MDVSEAKRLKRLEVEEDQETIRGIVSPMTLHVRRLGGSKPAIRTRAPMTLPVMPNQRWLLDPRNGYSNQLRSMARHPIN